MNNGYMKEVEFGKFCQKCRYFRTPEEDDPCRECLRYGALPYSRKPLKFEKGVSIGGGKKRTS